MLTFTELRDQTQSFYIPYPQLLKTVEWQNRRSLILQRDHCKCTACGIEETMSDYDEVRRETWHFWLDIEEGVWLIGNNGEPFFSKHREGTQPVSFRVADKPYHMQVHHKRYIRNRLPWEYDDADLVTLCNWCHSEFHQHFKVDRYAEDGVTLVNELETCSRCQGTGTLLEYKHVMGGVCFKCDGERYELPLVKVI